MRIKVVRDPQADRRLMLFRAYPGIDLAAGGRQQIHFHPALGKAGLQRLGDGDKRRFVLHV